MSNHDQFRKVSPQNTIIRRAVSLLSRRRPKTVRGFLDLATFDGASGWLQDSANPARRRTVRIEVNGKSRFVVVASAYREDLKLAGIGDGCHSFDIRFAPEELRAGDEIAAFDDATDKQLTRSPIILPRREHDSEAGVAETVADEPIAALPRVLVPGREIICSIKVADVRAIRGWIAHIGGGAEPLSLDLVVDGRRVGTCVADRPLAPVTIGGAAIMNAMGFDFRFPSAAAVSDDMLLQIFVSGTEVLLSSELARITTHISGGLDRCDDRIIRGWALNWNDLTDSPHVELFVNDVHVGTAVAERSRADLKRQGLGGGNCGFLFQHPSPIELPESRDVQVRAFIEGTKVELAHSPWWISRAVTANPMGS